MKERSLQKELGDWNRQENRFRELFSDEVLRDKEFQKMKLRAYDRLWHLYKGAVPTTDEQALLMVLRFQRRKMTRQLYPGRLRRAVHNLFARLRAGRERKQMQKQAARRHLDRYTRRSLPGTDDPGKNARLPPDDRLQKPLRKIYGPDLGRKQKRPGHNRGISI